MSQIEPGCLAIIIESVLGQSVGTTVQCVKMIGEHSLYGRIWRVHSQKELVSEYGGIGNHVDVPEKWLKKIEPPKVDSKKKVKENELL